MNWEIGIDAYTLLWIRQVTNENPLNSTGNGGELDGKEIQNRGFTN